MSDDPNPPPQPTALMAKMQPAAAAPERSERAIPRALTPVVAMPQELAEQIDGINQWAKANRSEARWETFWFWALKIPVVVATAGYGLLAKNIGPDGMAWAGAISAACVLIDGYFRPGSLRNAHHRAYFELRTLADDLLDQWDADTLRGAEKHNEIAARLIDETRKRKAKVTGYLAEAEASLGKGPARKTGKG